MPSRLILRTKEFDKVMKGLVGEAASQRATAGIHQDVSQEVLTRAIYNEFGTATAPARSFIRSTLLEEEPTIADMQREALVRVIEQTSTAKAELQKIANYVAEKIRAKIRSGVLPLNTPAVAVRKGRPQTETLRDSEEMLNAVRGKVERK